MNLPRLGLSIFLLVFCLSTEIPALERSGIATANETWRRADSPVYVNGQFTVERGNRLTVEPGVEIRFSNEGRLTVRGDLVARGISSDSIRFTSAGSTQPGSWYGIVIQNQSPDASYTDDGQFTGTGSALEYCIIEYAGKAIGDVGAALDIASASPLIANSAIRSNRAINGTIRCSQWSMPLIRDSRIEGNHAVRGGALSSTIDAQPIIKNNWIGFNRADDNGGAFYIHIAKVEISGNFIHSNYAGASGGALYAARVSNLTMTGNVLRDNRAGERAATILITEEVNSTITNNAFEGTGDVIFLDKAILPVDAKNNWWGAPPSNVRFGNLIRDRNVDTREPVVNIEPTLCAPPENLPTNPRSISSIILCRNDKYDAEIPVGVSEGAPLRIRLEGIDVNPIHRDVIQVKIVSAHDPQGIFVALTETDVSSGIFTGRGSLALNSNQAQCTIGDRVGGEITIFAPFDPSSSKNYPTVIPKPLITDLSIPDVVDIMHLVDHRPSFKWNYYEVVDRPQRGFKIDVKKSSNGASVWAPGEITSGNWHVLYDGTELEDGQTYDVSVSLFSGKFWGDPATLKFRVNSLPTIPQLVYPAENEILKTLTPELTISASKDAEGDSLTYELSICPPHGSPHNQHIEGLTTIGTTLSRTVGPLNENGSFHFRTRAIDPFEPGPWSNWWNFYINTIEEPPAPFNLVAPIDDAKIYDLYPELVWQSSSDPDPLSSVTYTVEVSSDPSFTDAFRYNKVGNTHFNMPDSLANRTTYYWQVTAVDNTGLTTRCISTGKFYVDTTPSVPDLIEPLAGEEKAPEGNLTWKASSDPDPRDRIIYDIRILYSPDLSHVVARQDGWEITEAKLNRLTGYESLVDNTVYYWAVRARDNHNAASDFSRAGSFFFNRINDVPSQPVILEPGELVTGTNDIRFVWQPSTDPDRSDPPSTLVYEIQTTLTDFNAANVKSTKTQPGVDNQIVRLDDNRLWHYRIRAIDNEGAVSDWSQPRTLLVNVMEDPPRPFALKIPADRSEVKHLDSLDFIWEESSDPDYNSSVSYRLTLTDDKGGVISQETDKTQWLFTGKLSNETTYNWRVTAIDNTGLETICRSEFTFRTNTTPSTPRLLTASNAILNRDGKLSWSASTDPDPRHKLTYAIQIADDAQFGNIIVDVEQVDGTDITISKLNNYDKLPENHRAFWRIKSVDPLGYTSPWSSTGEFSVNFSNEPPEPFNLEYPVNGITIEEPGVILKWQAARDPDPGDSQLTYSVTLARNAELTSPLVNVREVTGNSYNVQPGKLEYGVTYYWRVSCDDGHGGMTFGSNSDKSPWSFSVKAQTSPTGN